MTKRGLLLSYAFPPVALPEAFLAAKRMANIPDVHVDVLSAPPYQKWMGQDNSLSHYVARRFSRVERVSVPWFLRKLPFWRLGPLSKCPDSSRFLGGEMLKTADRMIQEGSYDFMTTWSQWHSIHLVGEALKKRYPKMTWHAYFSDPWSRNPYRDDGLLVDWINRRLEAKVVHNADMLLYSTNETRDNALSMYPVEVQNKSFVFPHGYDPSLYPPKKPDPPGSQLMVRYLGGLYGKRSPRSLIQALRELQKDHPRSLDGVRIEFIGPAEKGFIESLDMSGIPPNLLSWVSQVDYLESLELMSSADLLLIIDAPAKRNLFLPSKLIDYIGAAQPIFGITPQGVAEGIIKRLGGETADPENVDAIAKGLLDSFAKIRGGQWGSNWGTPEEREKYRVDVIGKRIAALIN